MGVMKDELQKRLETDGFQVEITRGEQNWVISKGDAYAQFQLRERYEKFNIRSGRLIFGGDSNVVLSYLPLMTTYFQRICLQKKFDIYEALPERMEDGALNKAITQLHGLGFMSWGKLSWQGYQLENTVDSYKSSLDCLKIINYDNISVIMEGKRAFELAFEEMKTNDVTCSFEHRYYANVLISTKFYCLGRHGTIRLQCDNKMNFTINMDEETYSVSTVEEILSATRSLLKKINNKQRITALYKPPRYHFYHCLDMYVESDSNKKAIIDRYFLERFSERELEELIVAMDTIPESFIYPIYKGRRIKRIAFLDHILIIGVDNVRIFSKEDAKIASLAFEEELILGLREHIKGQEDII